MSLPSPNLDVKTFQQIVDEAKRLIGQRCPDWTDHNVSDPGVTLIELFAGMTEMLLFRANQVPEKNHLKFLELLGVGLEPPKPARADLRFIKSQPIEDREGQEQNELTLEAKKTIAGTIRTDVDEAIEFSTDLTLKMVRPKLSYVVAAPVARDGKPTPYRAFTRINQPKKELPKAKPTEETQYEVFSVYQDKPEQGDCLYFGFAANVSGNLVRLTLECAEAGAPGINPDYPSQVWEYWDSGRNSWERLEVVDTDTSHGFSRTGQITLAFPMKLKESQIETQTAYWARCRYTLSLKELPAKGPAEVLPARYEGSPLILSLNASVTGGTVPASNVSFYGPDSLGSSDGTPGQIFRLTQSPILEFGELETLEVSLADESVPEAVVEWAPWTCVPNFALSEKDDCHFVCDRLTGTIYLGPSIRQPNGTVRQHGAVPPKGSRLRFNSYRYGGGSLGNVREGRIRILKSSNTYISEVNNPNPASGGCDRETVECAEMRAMASLRVRDRAVTAEDFEFLGREATKLVGRARCYAPTKIGADRDRPHAGTVRVLLVPSLVERILVPTQEQLQVSPELRKEVRNYLDQRRLLTTRVEIEEPQYIFVSTALKIAVNPRRDPEEVTRLVQDRLARYLHPLLGGPQGDGWPFLRTLTMADLYAQVAAINGVAFLLRATMSANDLDPVTRKLGERYPISSRKGLVMSEGQLITSGVHRIRTVPIDQIDSEQLAEDDL